MIRFCVPPSRHRLSARVEQLEPELELWDVLSLLSRAEEMRGEAVLAAEALMRRDRELEDEGGDNVLGNEEKKVPASASEAWKIVAESSLKRGDFFLASDYWAQACKRLAKGPRARCENFQGAIKRGKSLVDETMLSAWEDLAAQKKKALEEKKMMMSQASSESKPTRPAPALSSSSSSAIATESKEGGERIKALTSKGSESKSTEKNKESKDVKAARTTKTFSTAKDTNNAKVLDNVQSELAELRKMMEIQRKTIDAQHDTIAALKASRDSASYTRLDGTSNGGTDATTMAATVAANAVANRLEEQLTAVEARVGEKIKENRQSLSAMLDEVHANTRKSGMDPLSELFAEIGDVAGEGKNPLNASPQGNAWLERSRRRLAKVAMLAAQATDRLAHVLNGDDDGVEGEGSYVDNDGDGMSSGRQDASPRTALVQLVTAEANHELGSAIVKTAVSSPPQTSLSPPLGMPSSTGSTKLRMDDAGLAAIAGLVAPKEGTFTSGGLAENPVTTVAASRAQRAPRRRTNRDMMILKRVFDSLFAMEGDENGRVSKRHLLLALEGDEEVRSVLIAKSYSIITPLLRRGEPESDSEQSDSETMERETLTASQVGYDRCTHLNWAELQMHLASAICLLPRVGQGRRKKVGADASMLEQRRKNGAKRTSDDGLEGRHLLDNKQRNQIPSAKQVSTTVVHPRESPALHRGGQRGTAPSNPSHPLPKFEDNTTAMGYRKEEWMSVTMESLDRKLAYQEVAERKRQATQRRQRREEVLAKSRMRVFSSDNKAVEQNEMERKEGNKVLEEEEEQQYCEEDPEGDKGIPNLPTDLSVASTDKNMLYTAAQAGGELRSYTRSRIQLEAEFNIGKVAAEIKKRKERANAESIIRDRKRKAKGIANALRTRGSDFLDEGGDGVAVGEITADAIFSKHIESIAHQIEMRSAAKKSVAKARVDAIVRAASTVGKEDAAGGDTTSHRTNTPSQRRKKKIFVERGDSQLRILFADYEYGSGAREQVARIREAFKKLSEQEAFIALVDSGGDADAALGKLLDDAYYAEVRGIGRLSKKASSKTPEKSGRGDNSFRREVAAWVAENTSVFEGKEAKENDGQQGEGEDDGSAVIARNSVGDNKNGTTNTNTIATPSDAALQLVSAMAGTPMMAARGLSSMRMRKIQERSPYARPQTTGNGRRRKRRPQSSSRRSRKGGSSSKRSGQLPATLGGALKRAGGAAGVTSKAPSPLPMTRVRGTDKHVVRVTGDPKRERPRRVGARPRSAVASAAPGRLAKNYGTGSRPKFVEDATSRVAQLQDIPTELFAYSSPFRQELGRGKIQDVRQFGFISDL